MLGKKYYTSDCNGFVEGKSVLFCEQEVARSELRCLDCGTRLDILSDKSKPLAICKCQNLACERKFIIQFRKIGYGSDVRNENKHRQD